MKPEAVNRTTEETRGQAQWDLSPAQRAYLPFKRFLDVLFSIVMLIAFSPLLIVVAAIIKLDSPGPVIFRQQRAGKGGEPFTMYKFRFMYRDAEEQLMNLEADTGSSIFIDIKQRLEVDPRITRFGKFIRRSSIDEFPQLVNTIKGEMSLVGPRPLAMREHEAMNDYQRRRALVKPGITCIWQVSGRSILNEQTRVELDLQYIKEMGPWTDLALVVKTIPAVLSCIGAY